MSTFELFNPDRKNRFLNERYPNEGTRATNTTLFKSIGQFEKDLNIDISDFNHSEAVELLMGLKKKSFRSLDVAHSIIMSYEQWCLDEKYHKTFIPVFKLISKEELKNYVHKVAQKNSYFTRDQMYEICSKLYNAIDQAILISLFENIRGRTIKEFSFEELRNLKKKDIYPETNTIITTREPDPKNGVYLPQKIIIPVDPRTIQILLKASIETMYHKENGYDTGVLASMPIKDTPYLIRTIEKFTMEDEDRITVGNINSRFKNFRKYLNMSFLSPTLVYQSGLFDKCLRKELEIGEELKPIHYKQIFQKLELDDRNGASLKKMYEMFKRSKNSKSTALK